MSLLRSLAERVKAHDTRSGAAGEDAAANQTIFLRSELQRLGESRYKVFPPTFSLPIDPMFSARGFIVDKCTSWIVAASFELAVLTVLTV
jgi:hypothetical protein